MYGWKADISYHLALFVPCPGPVGSDRIELEQWPQAHFLSTMSWLFLVCRPRQWLLDGSVNSAMHEDAKATGDKTVLPSSNEQRRMCRHSNTKSSRPSRFWRGWATPCSPHPTWCCVSFHQERNIVMAMLRGLQHGRLSCPLPSSAVCSNSCPLRGWCHPTISSSGAPLLLLPLVFPSIRFFPNDLALCIRWPKYWSFHCRISPSNEYSGLIFLRVYWLDLLSVQETLKSLLQHHSLKASILQCSAFFMVQLSHLYMTTGETIALTIQT